MPAIGVLSHPEGVRTARCASDWNKGARPVGIVVKHERTIYVGG
jgi:hypothetical protein